MFANPTPEAKSGKKEGKGKSKGPKPVAEMTDEEIVKEMLDQIERETQDSWLKRMIRPRIIRDFDHEGGPALQLLKRHKLMGEKQESLEPDQLHQAIRVTQLYMDLYQTHIEKEPLFAEMSNEHYIEKKYNTLTRMMASPRGYSIWPDIMERFTPTIQLYTQYNTPEIGKVKVIRGNEVPPTLAKNHPSIRFTGVPGKFYTLLMTDPDHPSEIMPDLREMSLWLVANIPDDGDMEKGQVIREYIPPLPARGTDAHRIVFLLFEQNGWIEAENEVKIDRSNLTGREKFSTRDLMESWHLTPKGISFFTTDWDPHVSEFYESVSQDEPMYINEHQMRHIHNRGEKTESSRFLTYKVDANNEADEEERKPDK